MHTSQNSQSSSNCLYQTDPRLVLDSSDSRASIGTIPYNSHVQNVTFQWRASAMDQCPFPEPSAPNELTVPSWSKIREDNLVTKHHFMAPTMPHIELPGTEVSRDDKTQLVDHSLRYFYRPCVIDQEFPRSPSQLHQKGSKKVPPNLHRK
jgi:hypothetical protein